MGEGGGAPGPLTPLQRSIWPSCLTTLVVVLVVVLLFRIRMPPLPYGLVVVGAIWLLCFIGVFLWQAHNRRQNK